VSGIASCRLTRRVVRGRDGLEATTVRLTATATDRAGRRAVARRSYQTLGIYLQGAAYRDGAFTVALGRTYTLVVASSGVQPRYVDAAPDPLGPSGLDNPFRSTGHGGWAIGVTFTAAMRRQRLWKFGVMIGGTVHVITIHVT
jgi:hypothetical protein